MTKWSYIVRIGEGQNESQRSKGIRGSHGNLDKEQKKRRAKWDYRKLNKNKGGSMESSEKRKSGTVERPQGFQCSGTIVAV